MKAVVDVKSLVEGACKVRGEKKILTCKDALKLAETAKVKPADIGRACNELNIRFVQCQLGCFK